MQDNLGTKMQKKQYGAQIKAKVALAAIRGEQTVNEIGSLYGVHPVQVTRWKGQLVKGATEIFTNGHRGKGEEGVIDSLYQQIGKLQVENEWLKKKSGLL